MIDPELLQRARAWMAEARVDAWVVCDFRGSNPVLASLLPGPMVTRRVALVVPARGPERLLVHAIEAGGFGDSGVELACYRTHDDHRQTLAGWLDGCQRIAVEYSPGGLLPAVSWVDAGTADLLRGLGVELVSSADLLQTTLALWSAPARAAHDESVAAVIGARDAAFAAVADGLGGAGALEHEVQGLIEARLTAAGFDTDHPAIVAAGAHSGDPHYAPSAAAPRSIARGDWLLVDLWARRPGQAHIFADVTWVAATAAPSAAQQKVFDTVRGARDLVLQRLQQAWRDGEPLAGWQLDRLARDHITAAGYGDHVWHRTGHSLSPGRSVHGLGANLDDLESRDVRRLLPGTGFTVEPGIYLPDFGVRLEVDVYVDPEAGPTVTTPIQDAIVRLD